ncbi:DUF3558 family protein [Nocardia carnea]|uniref:DUF3558 family protein n=1 Tax=Nocardia carnea TaxID=37328 RepID=UPI002455B76C|nr:DUF3558 family protein [Nocardia carnea]
MLCYYELVIGGRVTGIEMNLNEAVPGLCLLIGLLLLPVGCGEQAPATESAQQSIQTSAAPTTVPIGPAVAWDPCTLPDTALSDTGLDPDTANDALGDDTLIVQACSWEADPPRYFVVVLSITESPYDRAYSKSSENGPVTTMRFGSRRAFAAPDTESGGCDLVVEMPYESRAEFIVTPRSPIDHSEACSLIRRHVEDLEQYLPTA